MHNFLLKVKGEEYLEYFHFFYYSCTNTWKKFLSYSPLRSTLRKKKKILGFYWWESSLRMNIYENGWTMKSAYDGSIGVVGSLYVSHVVCISRRYSTYFVFPLFDSITYKIYWTNILDSFPTHILCYENCLRVWIVKVYYFAQIEAIVHGLLWILLLYYVNYLILHLTIDFI